jgi:hypothetical protein
MHMRKTLKTIDTFSLFQKWNKLVERENSGERVPEPCFNRLEREIFRRGHAGVFKVRKKWLVNVRD